jgi:hypothetical protein
MVHSWEIMVRLMKLETRTTAFWIGETTTAVVDVMEHRGLRLSPLGPCHHLPLPPWSRPLPEWGVRPGRGFLHFSRIPGLALSLPSLHLFSFVSASSSARTTNETSQYIHLEVKVSLSLERKHAKDTYTLLRSCQLFSFILFFCVCHDCSFKSGSICW